MFIFQPLLLPASIRHARSRSRVESSRVELPKKLHQRIGELWGGFLRHFREVQMGRAANMIWQRDTETMSGVSACICGRGGLRGR